MQKKRNKLLAFFADWRNQSRYLKWMLAQTKPYIGSLSLLILLDVMVSLLSVSSSVVAKNLIDQATIQNNMAGKQIALFCIITLGSIVLFGVTNYLTTLIHEKYAFTVRIRIFDKMLKSQWQQVSAYHSEDLMTRLTNDVESFARGTAVALSDFFLLAVRLISAFCVLYHYDHVLALTALALGPLGALSSLLFGDKMKKYQVQYKETESAYRALMQESLASITVVKTFQQEEKSYEKLLAMREKRLQVIKQRNKWSALLNVSMQAVFNIGYLAAFSWGIYRLSTESITYGTMSVFLSLVSQVQGPVMGLAKLFPEFINILTSVGRIMEVDALAAEPMEKEMKSAEGVGLKMEAVCFAYQQENVLENVSLDISPGDVVGLVGFSGSGKTTLIRLILALVYPQQGRLCFYNKWGEKEIANTKSRRLIAYVPQGNSLQSGTIRQNMLLGKKDATQSEIWEALEIADAAGFIRKLPEGLDTTIQEKAGGLSEGQAQRIAIARAIIRDDAPILILDEATSALDEKTEEEVLSRLSKSKKLKTCLIITHRKTMLRYCTRAFEMKDTRVMEHGL